MIDIKNQAENYIYTTEKLINHDLKDKVSQEQGIKINDAIKDLKDSINKDDKNTIKTNLDKLTNLVNEVTTELYKKTQAANTQSSGTTDQNTKNNSQ